MNLNGRGFGVLTMNMEKTVCTEVMEAKIIINISIIVIIIKVIGIPDVIVML